MDNQEELNSNTNTDTTNQGEEVSNQGNDVVVVEQPPQEQVEEGIPIEEIHRDPNVTNSFANPSNFTPVPKNETAPSNDIVHPDTKKLLKAVHCRRCDCIVIAKGNATFVEETISLIDKKGSTTSDELKYMWYLKDMFQFENVAFSKDVDSQIKYLTCAECESEIIGIHYLGNKNNYIAHDRIVYK